MFTINQNLIDDFADKINEKEKKNNKVTSWSPTTTDAHYPSEKLVKDSLDSKASSSHTHGNLQNNGQVGSTAQANKNVVTDSSGKITTEDKPTIPSASSTTPSADTTNGSAGTGTTWARSNHTHPKSSLYAEANHTHSNYLTSHQDISGKEDKINKVTSWSSTTNDTRYPTEKLVKDSLDGKQASLESGVNIKTINNNSLLGSGNITIEGGSGSGGSYINDFYGDSSTNELVIDYYNGELTNNHYSLTSSNYNPSIDSTVTVTVTVTDHNGDGVSGESVLVTASEGNFTKYNGSTITGTSSYTGTTNSSGQFTLTYTCSEWGLITFTANNKTVQCNVTGFKKIAENTTYTLMVDESTRCCRIEAHRTGVTITNGQSFSNYNDFVIPTKYYPKSNCYSLIMRNATFLFWLWANGSYGVTNLGNTVTGYNLAFQHEWHY